MPCSTFEHLIIEQNQKSRQFTFDLLKNSAPAALLYFSLQHLRSPLPRLSTANRSSHFNANNHFIWKLKHKICVGRFIWTIMQIRQEMRLLLMLERCCIRSRWSDFSWRWTHWLIRCQGAVHHVPTSGCICDKISTDLVLSQNMGLKCVTFTATLGIVRCKVDY